MKTKVTIRLGRVEDAPAIMRFMGEHWRKGHILSLSRELLLHEFAEGNLLNFALAWRDDRLVGLFGFIRYNQRPVPDLAGSLWKVIASEKTPLLGIRLRRFVMDNVPHRFFAAPGAGPQTRPIYQIIGLEWKTMDHWFMLNPERNPEHCLPRQSGRFKSWFQRTNWAVFHSPGITMSCPTRTSLTFDTAFSGIPYTATAYGTSSMETIRLCSSPGWRDTKMPPPCG